MTTLINTCITNKEEIGLSVNNTEETTLQQTGPDKLVHVQIYFRDMNNVTLLTLNSLTKQRAEFHRK